MEEEFKTITAEEFSRLDYSKYTLVDLREPDELIISEIKGAINIPFSQFATKLDTIPKDKSVIVYCRVGDFSEQIAEILADRGYDVTHVEGGYSAYRKIAEGDTVKPPKTPAETAPTFIDAKGLKCPGPIVKVADYLRDKPDGTKIHVEATEDAFYSDIQVWCERTGNKLRAISFENDIIRADITKETSKQTNMPQTEQNDKTFVVFSGDLDKTIAAFIMANGAAAMGRKVTIFFTFWGLNILRRSEKVRLKKPFIEKMFGFMMPRGTKKLGLSRMNMGGMGAKMIRNIMKNKGVSSLEEL
ncbi:MAG: DsrE/DsrF/DrsH-like family protein, partial [Clostridia bacterium]|nr:DsrE/DsrF/DrsH-like family protein [Clostridia bacterium]